MKRMAPIVLGLMMWCGVAYAEELKLPEEFQVLDSSGPVKMVLTPYATYPVLLEEYVPTVLFEGKWGDRCSEFGRAYTPIASENIPNSIAVNSKQEIYILDLVNNRIQKFDKHGEFLKNIVVRSFCNTNGKPLKLVAVDTYEYPYYQGINIAVDLDDNLYYYCRKDTVGELWSFNNDVPENIKIIPSGYQYTGVQVDGNNDLWIGNYYVKAGEPDQNHEKERLLPWMKVVLPNPSANLVTMQLRNQSDNSLAKKYVAGENSAHKKIWFGRNIPFFKHGFFFQFGWKDDLGNVSVVAKCDAKGNLYSINIGSEIDFENPHYVIDPEGNIYSFYSNNNSFVIIKWIIKQ